MSARAKPVVVITGGSSGIGLATAKLFAARGYAVGLIARGEPALQSARAQIIAAGGLAATAVADVADNDAVEAAADSLEKLLGPPNIWINAAAIDFFGAFAEVSPDEFRRVMDVTFLGVVNGTRAALRRMHRRKRGSIVTVGGLAAFRGMPTEAPYSAAKFAVRGFVEALRAELSHSRIHLGLVHPPAVNTPFYSHAGNRMAGEPRPVGKVYQPEIVAEAIFLCATERRREIRAVGAPGFLGRFAPALAERIAAWTGHAGHRTSEADIKRRRDPAFAGPGGALSVEHGPFAMETFHAGFPLWTHRNQWMVGAGVLLLAALMLPRRARATPAKIAARPPTRIVKRFSVPRQFLAARTGR